MYQEWEPYMHKTWTCHTWPHHLHSTGTWHSWKVEVLLDGLGHIPHLDTKEVNVHKCRKRGNIDLVLTIFFADIPNMLITFFDVSVQIIAWHPRALKKEITHMFIVSFGLAIPFSDVPSLMGPPIPKKGLDYFLCLLHCTGTMLIEWILLIWKAQCHK